MTWGQPQGQPGWPGQPPPPPGRKLPIVPILLGVVIGVPLLLCGGCLGAGHLCETVVRFDEHHPSFPLGLA